MGGDAHEKTKAESVAALGALRHEINSLREESDLLRTAVELSNDAVFAKDLQGRYLMANAACARLMGKTLAELIGKDDTELFSLETAQRFRESDRQIIADGVTLAFETSGMAAGVQRLYRTTKGPWRDDHGRISGVVGIAQDITERKRAEEELRGKESLLAEAQQLAHIGSWSWDMASDSVLWSAETYRIFGLAPQEEAMTYAGFLSHVHPDDQVLVENILELAMRNHRPFDYCLRVLRGNGTERVVQSRGQMVLDASGTPVRMHGTTQDITEQRRAEQALEESRSRNQAIFENALDAILLIDSATRFVDANPAARRMLGYSREELLELTVRDMTPIETLDRFAELLSAFLSDGTQCGEYTLVCKGGGTVEVEYRAVANILPGLHLGILRNIGDRKRDEEALRAYTTRLKRLSQRVVDVQEEERRHLARELHDEIGQDLTVIGLSLVSVKSLCSAAALPQLNECIATLGRTLEEVRRLSLDLRPSMLDDLGLAAALRWLVDRYAQRAGLEAHFAIQTVPIDVSPVTATACFRIGQEALTNMVRHARARNVWIELHQRDNEVQLTIRDDGIGFDAAEARHRATTGASLGLLGMQERVVLLGGHLTIDSAPGGGTRIHVRLPTVAAPTLEERSPEGRSP